MIFLVASYADDLPAELRRFAGRAAAKRLREISRKSRRKPTPTHLMPP